MKILVVQFKKIGDDILTSALCNTLRENFPEAQIDYCVNEHSAELFAQHSVIDNVIPVAKTELNKPLRYLHKAWQLGRSRYDAIVDASSTGKSALISLLSPGSQYRIGWRHHLRGMIAYNHRIVPAYPQAIKMHPSMDLLNPLLKHGQQEAVRSRICLSVSDEEKDSMRTIMQDCGIDFARPVFAIAASSKDPARSWHSEKMIRLANHCLHHHQAQLVAFSGLPHEQQQIREFHQALGVQANVFSNVPTRKLRSLMALLRNCDLFLGNAGGARWIAQALDLPSVTVVNPADPRAAFMPVLDDRHQALKWQDCVGDDELLLLSEPGNDFDAEEMFNRITPEHVIPVVDAVVAKYLAQSTPKQHPVSQTQGPGLVI